MKITNIRSEELVNIISNNSLTEDDKIKLIEIFTPKNIINNKTKYVPSPEVMKRANERKKEKYHNDEQYRLNKIQKTKERYAKRFEELGIERKPKGRPRVYETPEEARQANLENIKRLYHENKTTNNPFGRPKIPLEDNIKKIQEKHGINLDENETLN